MHLGLSRTACRSRGTVGPGFRPSTKSGCVRPPRADAFASAGRTHPDLEPDGTAAPPSSPRSRAATNGPAEAVPRLVGPRTRGPRGLLYLDGRGLAGEHHSTLPHLSCRVNSRLTEFGLSSSYRRVDPLRTRAQGCRLPATPYPSACPSRAKLSATPGDRSVKRASSLGQTLIASSIAGSLPGA